MSELEPITREERLLNSISDGVDSGIEPLTREEHYLSAIAGESDLPADMTPITRREKYLQKIYDNGGAGGGGEAEGTVEINITQNGTITRNVARYASAEITTNVPNPSTGTKEITANGDHDVTDYATAHVDVPQPSGSTSITSNGTHDVTHYASAQVNVPNSYASSDEGKVVDNGALVAQTSRTVTANGTYDTTVNDEVVVNVPTGITPSGSQTFTENGTYDVTNIAEAVVNVEASGGIPVYAKSLAISNETDGRTEIVYNAPYLTTLTPPNHELTLVKLDITAGSNEIDVNANNSVSNQGGTLEILDLHGANVELTGYGLRYRANLKTVNAFVRSTISNAGNALVGSNKLETLYWQENAQTLSVNNQSPVLTEESLISYANGMNEGAAKTGNLHSSRKTMCNTIMGNSIEVTADGVTYHRFVADANGSMTLTEFITNVKGWTLS